MTPPSFHPSVEDPFLTTRVVAKEVGVSLRCIQMWCNSGDLKFTRTIGGHRRIRLSDAKALAIKMGTDPEPEEKDTTHDKENHFLYQFLDPAGQEVIIKVAYIAIPSDLSRGKIDYLMALWSSVDFYSNNLFKHLIPVQGNPNNPWLAILPKAYGIIRVGRESKSNRANYPELNRQMTNLVFPNNDDVVFYRITTIAEFNLRETLSIYLFA